MNRPPTGSPSPLRRAQQLPRVPITALSRARAYTQPLDQQAGGPLLHPPSPMYPGRNPGAALVEGLRMSPGTAPRPEPLPATKEGPFAHVPVMLAEVSALFEPLMEGVFLDATVGAGGHARALLEMSPRRRLVAIDRDPSAVAAASAVLSGFGERATVVKARFDDLGDVLTSLGVSGIAGALFDLGVSSPQLDRADRGFSYRSDAPLDMRMDPTGGPTAADLLASLSEAQLTGLFALHGEARFARRIARAIVEARPVTTTTQLAEIVSRSVPAAARRRGHPARRVFQALRAAVNEELDVLRPALEVAIDALVPGGRIAVISYHSGEDRIVKETFAAGATGGCNCPPGLPCGCGAQPWLALLKRGSRRPGEAETSANPRARSARLRAAERIGGTKPAGPYDFSEKENL